MAEEKITWKPVTAAVLKIDERPAKLWNVYQAEKKGHLILVQLGRRFLMLDTKAHEIYELDPENLERKGKELRWERSERNGNVRLPADERGTQKARKPDATSEASRRRLLPSAEWVVRDAGRARLVRVRLSAEGRVLEVQLPLQLDLRSLY